METPEDIRNIEVIDPVIITPNTDKMSTPEINLENISTEQLRAALEKKEAKAIAEQKRKKRAYEQKRNKTVLSLATEAQELSELLADFKERVQSCMEVQATSLAEYGEMRSNSKGGFSIRDEKETYKVRRTRETNPTWDERSDKAIALIKDFLHDAVKKRAEQEFNLIMSFLEKNTQGDLEYPKVMMLLSHENNYKDERWREGLRLLRESYKIVLKGFGYYFEKKDNQDKWETIPLNFSSL
ncbi:DUF3164 family protein [Tenacibaculum maritimum]|uniref:DUF3164 family protein n=1 Tax=Tenacibaculum maritimum TaxID=107401 RepID=UPI0012E4545B|nr:DUF3164 family protein [Tenacibaculum maritimum]CAA0254936.1 conserved hypothetical protein [Tenacibaculum maritimum]